MNAPRSIACNVRMLGVSAVAAAILLLAACQSPEERIAEHMERGQELLDEGDAVKAALEFRNVVQINEDHVGALYGLSQTELSQQKWRESAGLLRRVLDLDPNHFDANLGMCRLLFLGGGMEEALDLCEKADELQPDDARVLALKAAIHLKRGDAARATEEAKRALELDGSNTDAAIVLAAQALQAGDPKGALEYLQKGLEADERNVGLQVFNIQVLRQLGDEAGAEEALRKLVAMYPDNRAIHMALVRYHVLRGEKDKAEAELRKMAEANPDDRAAALEVVRFLNTYQGAEAAEAELRSLVAKNAEDHQFRLALIEVLWRRGERDEARELTRPLIESDEPGVAAAAKLQMARMHLAENETEETAKLVAEVLRSDKRNVDALIMRAALASGRGDYNDAIADLRLALPEEPESPRVLLALGEVYELNGSIDLADEQFSAAAQFGRFDPQYAGPFVAFLVRHGKVDRAEEVLNRVLEQQPNHVPSLTRLAQIRLTRRDWAGAEEVAERLSKLETGQDQSQQILGAALGGQGKFDPSIEVLRQAQESAPDAVQPLVALVNAYVRAGEEDRAMSLLEGIVDGDPKRTDAQVMIGSLLARAGKPEEAKARYVLAMRENPDNPDGYRAMGGFLAGQDNVAEALEIIETGLARIPDNPTLLLSKAAYLERLERFEDTIEVYQKLHELQPTSLVVANNLASLLAEHRDDRKSLDLAYQLARRLQESNVPQFKDTLGWIQFRRGQRDSAVTLLRAAVESPSPLPIYHYHLGMAYADKGLDKLAREQLTAALELAESQPFPLADEANKALAALATPAGPAAPAETQN